MDSAADRQVFQRDDGMFEVGIAEPLGPFETRQFAEAVAFKATGDPPDKRRRRMMSFPILVRASSSLKEIHYMGVIDLRRQFKKRADESEAIRQKGFREMAIDAAIVRLLERLERKGYSADEIVDRFRGMANELGELAHQDWESA